MAVEVGWRKRVLVGEQAVVHGPELTLRAGGRFRTLPFGFNGEKVSEKSFMAGFGAPLARNRASLDFSIQRANRTTAGDVDERGIILSFGLRVSP